MGIINCTNCKGEMIKLKNWKAQYNGDIANAFFDTTTIYAGRHSNSFYKGVGITQETPSMFVCPTCGKYELYFSKEQVKHIIEIENDPEFSDRYAKNNDNTTAEDEKLEYKQKPINLTRNMSRLKRRTTP